MIGQGLLSGYDWAFSLLWPMSANCWSRYVYFKRYKLKKTCLFKKLTRKIFYTLVKRRGKRAIRICHTDYWSKEGRVEERIWRGKVHTGRKNGVYGGTSSQGQPIWMAKGVLLPRNELDPRRSLRFSSTSPLLCLPGSQGAGPPRTVHLRAPQCSPFPKATFISQASDSMAPRWEGQ